MKREEASGSNRICQLASGVGTAAPRAASRLDFSFPTRHHRSEPVRGADLLRDHGCVGCVGWAPLRESPDLSPFPTDLFSQFPSSSFHSDVPRHFWAHCICSGNWSCRSKPHLTSSDRLTLGSTLPLPGSWGTHAAPSFMRCLTPSYTWSHQPQEEAGQVLLTPFYEQENWASEQLSRRLLRSHSWNARELASRSSLPHPVCLCLFEKSYLCLKPLSALQGTMLE